ncbi:right-handed parallel beta-helix repeat-containing protein [Paenibacillus roseipurpureus]|uniref:Right-handed parallel beta-helix repeat-containing protein n=1 Tax=Paenibacillus roseopurpureus TaxID=2918901 RepID=A0AA96LQF4_9BACL|nr:right-handed parallel beta-helix repeat-containing protein [Paenibacillus sp. MBLB1832]WNR42970.1 right-handed parallel beta-helix repeat-containing protein [Paenibacillus sp. MBLB1832]
MNSQIALFVSPKGNDHWSGTLSEPNENQTDGPLASVYKAKARAAEIRCNTSPTDEITVYLREGRYSFRHTLAFTEQDAGGVSFQAYPGETPIIDGGKRIQGWQKETLNGKEVWVTYVLEVKYEGWQLKQLFVNGSRRERPRLPKQGYYWIEDVPGFDETVGLFDGTWGFICKEGDFQNWSNAEDIEAVVLHHWIEERLPVRSFQEEERYVSCSKKSIFALKHEDNHRFAKYYVENVFEALTEPGEWYVNSKTGKLYYLPMEGEQLDQLEVYAPYVETLISLKGDAAERKYIKRITFQGLVFEHAAHRHGIVNLQDLTPPQRSFLSPDIDYAGSVQGAHMVSAALHFEGTIDCGLIDCEVRHCGGYAIELGQGCFETQVVGNRLYDLGGGGVKVGGTDAYGAVSLRNGRHQITDNHIHHCGLIYMSSIGILLKHSYGNRVAHNHIHDLYYSGISCGWVWSFSESVSKENFIEKNHIHHLGQKVLSDMGGIYLLGVQPGTYVRGNVIHDIECEHYGGWAIYLDAGSSYIIIENNIAYRCNDTIFHQHYGKENIVRNNIMYSGGNAVVALSNAYPHNNLTFERNIVLSQGKHYFAGGYACDYSKHNLYADLNLFWHTEDATGSLKEGKHGVPVFTLDAWQSLGYDRNSIVADPGFKDLVNGEYELTDDSPAIRIGFRPFDLSDAGPRSRVPKGVLQDVRG